METICPIVSDDYTAGCYFPAGNPGAFVQTFQVIRLPAVPVECQGCNNRPSACNASLSYRSSLLFQVPRTSLCDATTQLNITPCRPMFIPQDFGIWGTAGVWHMADAALHATCSSSQSKSQLYIVFNYLSASSWGCHRRAVISLYFLILLYTARVDFCHSIYISTQAFIRTVSFGV